MAEVTGRGELVRWDLGPGEVPVAALEATLPGCGFTLRDGALLFEAGDEVDLDEASVAIAGALSTAGIPIRGVQRGTSLEESFLAETQEARGS